MAVTTDDLTAEQIERIERAVEVPLNRWMQDAPKGLLFPLILAEASGEPVEKYRKMKLPALLAAVTLDAPDEDADPNG